MRRNGIGDALTQRAGTRQRLLILVGWLVAGCYSPNLEDRSLLCGGDSGECPSPMVCGCDGRCHAEVIDKVVEIRGGNAFTCARRASGTVACAGKNDMGELGDGTGLGRSTPAPVLGLSSATILSVGATHSCALDRNGAVWCWGEGGSGRLGDGFAENRFAPVAVSLPVRAIDVAAGGRHSCALLETLEIWCWGNNSVGQLGNTSGSSAVPVIGPSLVGVIDIDAAGDRTCARTDANDLWCWGGNDDGELGVDGIEPSATPQIPIGLQGQVAAASLGRDHTCVLTIDGRALCWGDNDWAQVGDGTNEDRLVPTPVFAPETGQIAQLAAGVDHTCFLRADGTGYCVGNNNYSQLGDGTAETRLFPVPVTGLADAIGLGLGLNFSCAWHRDGTTSCWGANLRGQLGNGEVTVRNTPMAVPGMGPATEIAVGYHHSCARIGENLSCWGRNDYGQLGDNTDYERHAPMVVPSFVDATSLAPGYLHSCAVKAGRAWCWGRNSGGQVGDNSAIDRSLPRPVYVAWDTQLTNVVQVATGLHHSCALVDDAGATSVYCWGRNDFAQLGSEPSGGLMQIIAVQVPGLDQVTQLTAGAYFTCALRAETGDDTSVRCWGINGSGQLGDGTITPYAATPVTVQSLTNAAQISAGYAHTCALTTTNEVVCWGRNFNGELARDPNVLSESAVPIEVEGVAALEVGGGLAMTCARLLDDSVSCWGANSSGELGDGTLFWRATPGPVANGLKAVELATKYSHTCARSADGAVWCWGLNANGQLGDGTTSGVVTPIVTPFSCPGSG
ncbi:MAG: RCC1 repeat-containing protein [Kofleriaceae bacterium]